MQEVAEVWISTETCLSQGTLLKDEENPGQVYPLWWPRWDSSVCEYRPPYTGAATVADQNRYVICQDISLLGGPHAMQEVGGQIPAETYLILGTLLLKDGENPCQVST